MPDIYLIEPYNAYQKPPKKKHWHEIIEEEALYHQMLQEAESLRQAKLMQEDAMKQALNLALKSQQPQPSSLQVQDAAVGAPANAGAGGVPPFSYFVKVAQDAAEPTELADFSFSPASGISPLLVSFTNLTPTPDNDTFLWDFGSGSATSTSINPSITYTTSGSYTITLYATSSTGNMTTASKSITVSIPTLIAGFTLTTSSATAPSIGTFANTSTYNGSGTLTRLWVYGSGSLTSSAAVAPSITYTASGSYTASLSVTESLYNKMSFFTRSFSLS